MVLPVQTSLQYLKVVFMNGCHAGAAKVAAKASSAWYKATSVRIANLHIKFQTAKEPGTYLSSGKLGRMIKDMQMFEDAAPASDLPPPQAAEQLAAFVASLVPPGQQGGADWVDLLCPLEWQARRRQADSQPAAAGLGYASSAPHSTSQHLEEEDGCTWQWASFSGSWSQPACSSSTGETAAAVASCPRPTLQTSQDLWRLQKPGPLW